LCGEFIQEKVMKNVLVITGASSGFGYALEDESRPRPS
jgi:NADP-dependent 3-hydroxy acid dehydrogenase YdfG